MNKKLVQVLQHSEKKGPLRSLERDIDACNVIAEHEGVNDAGQGVPQVGEGIKMAAKNDGVLDGDGDVGCVGPQNTRQVTQMPR